MFVIISFTVFEETTRVLKVDFQENLIKPVRECQTALDLAAARHGIGDSQNCKTHSAAVTVTQLTEGQQCITGDVTVTGHRQCRVQPTLQTDSYQCIRVSGSSSFET